MKIFDPKRHLPVGWDWEALRTNLLWGHGFSTLSLLVFLVRYFDARDSLYLYTMDQQGRAIRTLVPGRIITPFPELMAGLPLLGAWCFAILMGLQVWRCYSWHTQGAMSIYTMRRLPDRWELHRRCLMQPVLSVLAELALFAILTGLCWLLWWFCTPAPCRPL